MVTISEHDLTPGIADLVERRTDYWRADTLSGWEDDSWAEEDAHDSRPFREEGPVFERLTSAELLTWSLVDHGSSRAAMVEVPGIEPGSSAALRGLLRAQFTVPLLDPIGHVNKPV